MAAAAGAVALVLALTGLDRRDLDGVIARAVTFTQAVTGLSFTATSTGNAFVAPSTGKVCLNGSTCTVNASYDGSAALNFSVSGLGFQMSNTSAGAAGPLRGGTSSTNIAEILGSVSGQPVSYGIYGGVGDANADVQLAPKGTGKVKVPAPLIVIVPKRMSQELHINLVTDTAFTTVGLPAPTLLAGTPTADTTDAAYQMIKFTTGAVSTNASGFSGPFTEMAASYLPMAAFVVRTDPAAVTTTRLYVGFGASPGLDQVATLAAANTIRGCWFRYDTGIGDANWFAESSDGTTASATDTTIAVAAATTYTLGIDLTVAGACDFWVNGVRKVAKSTNIPSGNTALGLEASVTTLAASARAFSVSKAVLQQN